MALSSSSINACMNRGRSRSWRRHIPTPARAGPRGAHGSRPPSRHRDHIATKLIRHFVADEPPPALVERLAGTFRDSDGDLKEVAKALIAAPEAWSPTQVKLKRPMGGGDGARERPARDPGGCARSGALGQPIWRPPSPKALPTTSAWIDTMGQRLDIANNFAERAAERVDPNAVVETALGPMASAETRTAVARAESRQQGSRWRSWRRNFNGGDHVTPAFVYAARRPARHRRALCLGLRP